jgi:predicted RNase H-like nuclease (RuvC/YqgF family)
MAIEEKVVQSESVTPADQPVAETPSQPQAPNLDSVKTQYEEQIKALKKELAEKEEDRLGVKRKLNEVYQQKENERKQELEDQGQWKTLWEEANKTAQDKDAQISNLSQQLEDLKTSNEVASTKQTALAAISNLNAINAEQTLSLLQGKLQRNAEGKVVIIDGGVEQDLNAYLTSLKNPGSGWEHHFKPSTAAGMGAKPSPVGNVSGGSENPWKTGNLTQQLIMENENPDLAAVLKREAQTK